MVWEENLSFLKTIDLVLDIIRTFTEIHETLGLGPPHIPKLVDGLVTDFKRCSIILDPTSTLSYALNHL